MCHYETTVAWHGVKTMSLAAQPTSLFTGVVIDGKLICVLYSLLILPIEQQHCQTGTCQKNGVEPPMKELELQLTTQGFCDGASAFA